MDNNEVERAHNLLPETAEVMTQFKQNSNHIVRSLQGRLDESLCDQREMITDMVRNEVMQEMSILVAGYVRDMENARNQMMNQMWEFSSYLNKVNDGNKKIPSRLVLIVLVFMAILIIDGLVPPFSYPMPIEQKKQDVDTVGRINRINIMRCSDELCAKTGKSVENDYRAIQHR